MDKWVVKKVSIMNNGVDTCSIYGPYTLNEAIVNMHKLKEIYHSEWDYEYDGGCYVNYAEGEDGLPVGQLSISVELLCFPELIGEIYKGQGLTKLE